MTRVWLLESLKARMEQDIKDLIMPVKAQKGDTEEETRPAEVWNGRLPDMKSTTKKAPYVLNTILTSRFRQVPGQPPESLVSVRTVYCVYNSDDHEGALMLLNLMDRIRISLQKNPIVDGKYELNMTEDGITDFVYPDDTAPFFMGEMVTEWIMPPVEREVQKWLY